MKIVLKNADKNLQYALDELALEFPLLDGETIELETKNSKRFVLQKENGKAIVEYASYNH